MFEQREDPFRLVPGALRNGCAAAEGVGRQLAVGRGGRGKEPAQASALTCVTQPASASASVAKLAIVGVWPLLSGSWMVVPQPPVARSTKLGTLPAAIFSCSGWPLIAVPSMNWLCVHTDATVVISLIVTFAGGLLPSTVIRAITGLAPPALFAVGVPPWATR